LKPAATVDLDHALPVEGLDRTRNVVKDRTEELVQRDVAARRELRRRRRDATVIHGEMACQAEPGGGDRDLSLAVGLHGTAGHQRVGAGLQRVAQHVAKLPHFVASEPETVQWSRFTHSDGPPRYFERRSIGSSGVGRWARSMGRKRASRAWSCALSVTS
jgi:hypothetical protein